MKSATAAMRATSFLVLLAVVLLAATQSAAEEIAKVVEDHSVAAAAADGGGPQLVQGGDEKFSFHFCNPFKLKGVTACKSGIETGHPSAECCDSLRDIEPCLCFFVKSPVYGIIIKAIFQIGLPRICGLENMALPSSLLC